LISRFGRAGEDLRAKLRRDPLNRAAHPSATFGALRGGVSGDASVGMRGIAAERQNPAYTVEKRDVEMLLCTPASFNVGLCLAV